MERRTFIQTCLAGATGVITIPANLRGIGKSGTRLQINIPKTDTHVHLFDLENLSYSWLNNAPEINRSFSITDFQEASKDSNIGKILFMESGADDGQGIKEARWVSSLINQEPRIKGIIAKMDLTDKDSKKDLSGLEGISLLKGIRGNFPQEAASSSIFREGLKTLAARKLSFDLLISLPLYEEAAKIAQLCPQNVFILDHLGNPDLQKGDFELWKKGIRKLAEHPNVNCKLSGIITKAGKDWTEQEISPYLLYCIEQFGTDRVVYGGDWPVVLLAGSYHSWSAVFEKITAGFSEEELHRIYHLNADRIYNL